MNNLRLKISFDYVSDMEVQEFIQELKRKQLTKQQRRTLKGQAVLDLEAAKRGLETIERGKNGKGHSGKNKGTIRN